MPQYGEQNGRVFNTTYSIRDRFLSTWTDLGAFGVILYRNLIRKWLPEHLNGSRVFGMILNTNSIRKWFPEHLDGSEWILDDFEKEFNKEFVS